MYTSCDDLFFVPRPGIYDLNRKMTKEQLKQIRENAPKLVKKSKKNGKTYVPFGCSILGSHVQVLPNSESSEA